PDSNPGPSLAERLKDSAGAEKVAAEFLKLDWEAAAKKGNAARGAKLFSAEGMGCAKCHAVRNDVDVQGGPSLAEAGRRFTVTHLVESILLPSKQVSPVFRATQIVTVDGKSRIGLQLGETGDKVEVLLPDGKRVSIL